MTNLPASGRLLNTSDFLLNFHIFIPFTEEKDRVWLPESWPSLDQEDPWRRERQPTPVFLPGEVHGQRSLVDYSPWGRKESDITERIALSLARSQGLTSLSPVHGSWSVCLRFSHGAVDLKGTWTRPVLGFTRGKLVFLEIIPPLPYKWTFNELILCVEPGTDFNK